MSNPIALMNVHILFMDERSDRVTRDEERKRVRWYLDKWGRYDEISFNLLRDIETARERIEETLDIKAAPLTGMPRGNDVTNKTAATAEKHMRMEERWQDHIEYLEERLEEETRIFRVIDEAIGQLDFQEQRVIRMRYREEKSFEQIAQRIHYSKRGVEQIAERAIDKLKLQFVVTVES
jgi:RNA polymerase sigma factor (sigma-70 family)